MFVLPKEKKKPVMVNPRNLVIFAKPKVGKTSLIAGLDDCLILDFENGTDSVESMSVKITSVEDIKQVGEAIRSHKEATGEFPYKYIAIDTITALEEMCIGYAEVLYSQTTQGKNWFTKGKAEYGDITGMPNGAGYRWLRTAFENIIAYVEKLAPHIILIGHVKDIFLEKAGAEVNSLELDLTGRLKRITAAKSDAIGYLVRRKDGNYLSFKTSDDVACGARPVHLKNKEILISKVNDEGQLMTFWDEIYI